MGRHKPIQLIKIFLILIFELLIFFSPGWLEHRKSVNSSLDIGTPSYQINAKRDLLSLLLAYPDDIKTVTREKDGIFLVMSSGKRIIYDDKKQKSFEEKLACADLQDMLEQPYPLSDIKQLSQGNLDPGRIRAYDFLKEIYGSTKRQISGNLANVPLGSKHLPFNKNNNAASALKAAFGEILKLLTSNPEIYGNIYPIGGTYNFRFIAGTKLLSPHAFGIAIDLKSENNGYWKWATRERGQLCLNSFPRELVRAFENNYFVWGGKWAHFDIFHFEYRPELIIKSKYHADNLSSLPWHSGFPDTDITQGYVEIIETAFK